jgi:thiamine biosynthesis lipoprotein
VRPGRRADQEKDENMSKKIFFVVVAIFLFVTYMAPAGQREVVFNGKTMGTTFHITISANEGKSVEGLREKIDRELEQVNREMSTYRKDSLISRFNASEKSDVAFPVSEKFMEVLRVSKSVYEITGGAWDGTVNPLLDLWGFRSKKGPYAIPEKKDIQEALSHVGFGKIVFVDGGHIMKKDPRLTLDLASIAKGHGVDRVSGVLLKSGFKNFIVEIGGEIYAAGLNAEKKPWRAGVNTPDRNAPFDQVYEIVTLTDAAMATSGDYRNFVEIDGRFYSHIVDPRTGYPVENGVAAAIVVAPTCTFADGLATAAMVMGRAKSIELFDKLSGVEGLVITRDSDGVLKSHYSKGLSAR